MVEGVRICDRPDVASWDTVYVIVQLCIQYPAAMRLSCFGVAVAVVVEVLLPIIHD